ncbi:tetratricopeptide repeat-containing sensor histidine kinase [Marinoscillum furvescens]|uniref:tetratricopeptide repeat-containing sensor histidine kinase n=1 Tax=Marinoscillum furvescens TaxID=1026 RepID=UPI0014765EF9|nr:ATP-binding protein [Marinoscillum furvescens]
MFDSLELIYKTHRSTDSDFEILNQLAFHANNPDTSLFYARKCLESSSENYQKSYSYSHIGNALRLKGDYLAAVDAYLTALDYAETIVTKSTCLLSLADTYSITGNHPNAVKYYQQAISGLESNPEQLANALINLGDEYFNVGVLDSALHYFKQAGQLYEQIGHATGIAYNLGNIGLVYAEQGKSDAAEANIQQAVSMLEEMEDYYGISVYLTYMSDIYRDKGDFSSAQKYCERSLRLAENYGLKEQIRDASLKLSELLEQGGDIARAYTLHKQYVAYRDSINNEETIQKIADLRTEYEVGQKQAELDLLTAQQRIERLFMIGIAILAVILLMLGAIIFKFYRQKSKINLELERLNETKDKFFSIISHDLRGPVMSFMGISRMIKFLVKNKATDQLLEVADDIDNSVQRLSGLLDNLLNWAMQQQGHFSNVPEKISLRELCEDLVKTLDTMAQAKKITLEADISTDIHLWADRNSTMTILRNLVSNALKFTPEGGSVRLSATCEREYAVITITDTGVGISQDKLQNLFRLQAKKSTYGTSGEKGLGLGLQLVHEFVEMNGGLIGVHSKEGEGTTFTVKIPVYEHVQDTTSVPS